MLERHGESGEKIEIKEVNPEVFYEALKYIYCGNVDHLESMAAPLLAVADKFALHALKNVCEESLVQNINAENVGSLYMLADVHSADHLKSEAWKLIQQQGGLGSLIGSRSSSRLS